MPIGITEEHAELARSVGGWCDRHCPPSALRAALGAEAEALPGFWAALAEQGWTGLHVAEEHGGSGYSLEELAVALEELGRRCVPGPFLPTVLAAAVLDRAAGKAAGIVPALTALATGEAAGAVALAGSLTAADAAGAGSPCRGRSRRCSRATSPRCSWPRPVTGGSCSPKASSTPASCPAST